MMMSIDRIWRYAGTAILLSCFSAGPRSLAQAEDTLILEPEQDGIQRATITLDSYSYMPKHLVVHAGKPVELTLHSVTTLTPHNFLITDPASGLKIEQDTGAGKTAVVKFTP